MNRSRRWRVALLTAVLTLGSSAMALAQPSPAEPSLPSPLRLRQVMQYARQQRAEIVAARARARAAAQRPRMVSALEDPVISASLDHLPFMLDGADVSLSVEQRFPLSRVRQNQRRAAEAGVVRLRADVERVQLDVELDAGRAFLMLEERRRMSSIAHEQVSLAQQFVIATGARYASGTGSQADVLRAEIEVSRLQGQLHAIHSEVAAAEAMLNASLARSPDSEIPPLESSANLVLPPEWRGARAQAMGQRPELAAGRAEIAQAEAEVDVMQSMYSPMAMLKTGPAYTMSAGPGWMLMVGISVPLWRDRLDAGALEAQAMVDMAKADLSAMTRMVEGETAVARHRVLAARARCFALQSEIIPRAQRLIEPSLTGYAAGTLPLVSVIEAAQTLWSAQAELVQAEFELGLAWTELERAMAAQGSKQ